MLNLAALGKRQLKIAALDRVQENVLVVGRIASHPPPRPPPQQSRSNQSRAASSSASQHAGRRTPRRLRLDSISKCLPNDIIYDSNSWRNVRSIATRFKQRKLAKYNANWLGRR